MTNKNAIHRLMLSIPLIATFTQLHATNQFKALQVKDFIQMNQSKVGITPRRYTNMLKSLIDDMADDDLILVTPKTNNGQFAAPYSITYTKSKDPLPPPATKALQDELYTEKFAPDHIKPLIIDISDNGTNYEKTLLNLVISNLFESMALDDKDPITNIKTLSEADYGRIAAEYAYYFDEEQWLPKFNPTFDKKRELPTNVPTITQGILFSKAQLQQQLGDTYIDQAFNKVQTSHSGFMYTLKKRDDKDPLQQQSFLYQLARHGAIVHIQAPAMGSTQLQIANVQVDALALTQDAQAVLAEMAQAQNHILQYEADVNKKLNAWDQLVDDFTTNLQADDQANGQLAQQLGVTVSDNKSATLVTALKQIYAAKYKPGEVIALIEQMMDMVQPPQKATENNQALTATTETADNQQYDVTIQKIQEQ